MVKGQPAVVWNAEQDAKLLCAILEIHNIDINYNAVAKAFGDNVPGRCISFHIAQIRKKANEQSGASASSSLAKATSRPGKVAKTSAPRTSAFKGSSKKRKRGGILTSDSDGDEDPESHETSENENTNGERFHTAPATPSRQTSIVGQVTKPRVSPRKLAKKDYKAIEDPFAGSGAHDADGNEIFAESPDDDSLDNEDEYGKAANAAVKQEEEMAV